MASFFKNLFDSNAHEIKKYTQLVNRINALEPAMQQLSDEQLAAKTAEFKQRLDAGASLNDLMLEAYAVVREASVRVLGMRHFNVQLIGGMALHDGRIAEMKTGEGKTLVATCPVYLNALSGKGVHMVTVNEYLSARDSQWMGKLYKFLGLSVGLIGHNVPPPLKKQQYNCDITFGTNNEFGFDYLRDNMAVQLANQVQRELHFAIIDEVDSILIDEARTPLIISGQAEKPTERYYQMAKIAARMRRDEDFTVDEKARAVMLTPTGVAKVEHLVGVDNLYDNANTELNHFVQQALKAEFLFKRDRDYVVKDGQVIIVDEFTGRLMDGRRYSDGLHQAIEAKENVIVMNETQTLASITLQNYFRMYQKIAGMTGTAMTEEEEFRTIYGLDVVEIPTNKPLQRKDLPDVIYRTEPGKFRAVVEDIAAKHAKGQPVLVGTVSIEKSEILSQLLKQKGIPHQVLNAKYHEQEAEIIAQAGKFGAVTIATNMAGRGTDIMLGGNPEFMLRQMQLKEPEHEWTLSEEREYLAKYENEAKAEREKVLAAGGLAIIGTERHESRRIDNQLRGRSGRQGDIGQSQFYISVDDDLMRRFGGDSFKNMLDKIGMDDTMPIEVKMVSKSIENAQKRVESRNFDIRKNVLEYDNVMNQQRKLIYQQRQDVLSGQNLHEQVLFMLKSSIEHIVKRYSNVSEYPEEWDLTALLNDYTDVLPEHSLEPADLARLAKDEVVPLLYDKAAAHLESRSQKLGEEMLHNLERMIILKSVDEKWMEHIDAMDQLRQGVGYQAIGHQNPVTVYKNEAFDMFEAMIADIQLNVSRLIQRVEVVEAPKEHKNLVASHGGKTADGKAAPKKKTPVHAEPKIRRNDPCPCGSGKKYKNCCGRPGANTNTANNE
ncbi:MAG TPA: preprotein translocase subunit SecA [Candidatus Avidehalobacter gallistercoris]|uniref:Protein translocase subunit SecA n=1 Tax=Candidatus Avidehalobacter gallistercoris TaxID=2840694 RepID=A0A9D1KZJ7_9FIRM|nr:preprotein translocase subunit SecA [Candidatus Avidehalobacter gallistercoris]